MESEGSLPHSKCTPHVPILSQIVPVHTPTSHLLKINLNIIPQSTPRSPKWSLSLRFPHENAVLFATRRTIFFSTFCGRDVSSSM